MNIAHSRVLDRARKTAITAVALLAASLIVVAQPGRAAASGSPCGASINPIVCENSQTSGVTSQSVWDVKGAGDSSIQGFTTDISANTGGTVTFKIKTAATRYTIDIYRLGYYNGNGARRQAATITVNNSARNQPACRFDSKTSLVDCGNWAVSASWAVPSTAASGVYVAKLIRSDTRGASLIAFVVRNDASTSDIVYQTSDETWEGYNRYGGYNFYTGSATNEWDNTTRARKLSYNRPFITRGDDSGRSFLFSNEYPTIRFLERNGYDVSYMSGVDVDRYGSLLTHHRAFLSVGHDEYWAGAQRANVQAARDAGVNLMFLSGNEVFWHTRFEASIDGSNTAYRTLVCYKETWDDAATDPGGTTA
ncbi:MAG TPA: N,N-dimethylformamidase beta subunit family domain-containing protein, partial [Mycobacterium sp.]|nr:N,N-dimethylformamidase beta subunit family domain-containing protein [Mycobacterium sp.]